MSLESLLINRCTVTRWTPRDSDADDFTLDNASYSSDATGVKCNIQEFSARTIETAGGHKVMVNARGYFLPEADLKPASGDSSGDGDIITLTTPATGAKYEVVGVVDQTGREKFKKAFLRSV